MGQIPRSIERISSVIIQWNKLAQNFYIFVFSQLCWWGLGASSPWRCLHALSWPLRDVTGKIGLRQRCTNVMNRTRKTETRRSFSGYYTAQQLLLTLLSVVVGPPTVWKPSVLRCFSLVSADGRRISLCPVVVMAAVKLLLMSCE